MTRASVFHHPHPHAIANRRVFPIKPSPTFHRVSRSNFNPTPSVIKISRIQHEFVHHHVPTISLIRKPLKKPTFRAAHAQSSELLANLLGALVLVTAITYWVAGRDVVPVTKRVRLMAIPMWLELSIGKIMSKDFFAHEGKMTLDPQTSELAATVHLLTTTILQGAKEIIPNEISPITSWEWKVYVVDSPLVNASCFPGGNVVVYSGLIEFAMRAHREGRITSPVDAVAHVIAHEISHGIARHSSEKLSWIPIQLPFLFLATGSELLRDPFNYIFALPHSRHMESEADTMAVSIMITTGFDTREGAAFLRLFEGPRVGDWISTHPAGIKRQANIEAHTHPEDIVEMGAHRTKRMLENPFLVGALSTHPRLSLADFVVVTQGIWDKMFGEVVVRCMMRSITLAPVHSSIVMDYAMFRCTSPTALTSLRDPNNKVCVLNAARVVVPHGLVAGACKAATQRPSRGEDALVMEPVDMWMSFNINKANEFYDASKSTWIVVVGLRNKDGEKPHPVFTVGWGGDGLVMMNDEVVLDVELLRKVFDLGPNEDLVRGVTTRIALARV